MALSFLGGAAEAVEGVGRLIAGRGATMDFVRAVGTVFAESFWDITATCCRSRLYCLVKSEREKKGQRRKERKGQKRPTSFGDFPVLVFDSQIVEGIGIGIRV